MAQAKVDQNNYIWIYGKHATIAALNNPKRKIKQILLTKSTQQDIKNNYKGSEIAKTIDSFNCSIVNSDYIEKIINTNSPHQGIAAQIEKLPSLEIEDVFQYTNIAILDQITDPQNIGAILRSAAAFNIEAIICLKKNSPPETASIAKAASGALESVPIVRVTNISRAVEQLKNNGFWIIGLDGYAKSTLEDLNNIDKTVIALGAEGAGLRELTKKNCDFLVKINMTDKVESLNVSNAAAIIFNQVFQNTNKKQ